MTGRKMEGLHVPGLRTARHSSGVRWSGYDVMVFLVLLLAVDEVPKRALRNGKVMDFRGVVLALVGRGATVRKVAGRVRLERVSRMRKSRACMKVSWGEMNGAVMLEFICLG
jgi:hypothetical protein